MVKLMSVASSSSCNQLAYMYSDRPSSPRLTVESVYHQS